MKNFSNIKLIFAAIFMILFWGGAYVGIRAGLTGYSPGSMALFRYMIASICMLIIYWRYLKHFRRPAWRDLFLTAVLGILGFSIYNIALNYGELTVTAGMASFIICQIPVFMTLYAVIYFNDQLRWFGWIGTLLSFFGIFLIALAESHGFHFNLGVLFVLIATITGAIFSIFQKPLLKKLHPIEFTAFAIWFGTLAMGFYLPQLWHELPRAPALATAAVIFNGIFPAAIAYLLWGYILAQQPATKAASYLYIVPVVAAFLGWLLLHETLSVLEIAGGLLALGGAFLVHRGVIHSK